VENGFCLTPSLSADNTRGLHVLRCDPCLSDAFQRLEQLVPLKGNRFFATFDAVSREYRACVALKPGQTAAQLGLPEGILPGGRYATGKLTGAFAEIVRRIAPTLAQMPTPRARPCSPANRVL
jgi:hypothetical protein